MHLYFEKSFSIFQSRYDLDFELQRQNSCKKIDFICCSSSFIEFIGGMRADVCSFGKTIEIIYIWDFTSTGYPTTMQRSSLTNNV